ncbi:MAG: hypothetical protein ACKOB0_13540 [Chthoniobacterales bacterium]
MFLVKKKSQQDPDMLPEYDFSNGVRGKYAEPESKHGTLIDLLGDEHVANVELELPKLTEELEKRATDQYDEGTASQ